MKIELLPDGSMLFSEPPSIVLKGYMQDTTNPLLFKPKAECRHRENRCRRSKCGRHQVFEWWCQKLKKRISMKICEDCDVREK